MAKKQHHRRHPRLVTRIVNGIGLVIGFNQEIGSVVAQFQNGTWTSNPQVALNNLVYKAIGFDPASGNFSPQQLLASIGSKAAGYTFAKVTKYFLHRMRI